MAKEIQGVVQAVLISRSKDSPASERMPQAQVGFEGFSGDRHSSLTYPAKRSGQGYPIGKEIRNTRQVSIVSVEELNAIAKELGVPEVFPEQLSANLLIEGVPYLSLLPPGTRLLFSGGVGLVVDSTNHPCTSAGELIAADNPGKKEIPTAFVKAALNRRGIVAWVESEGTVSEGDTVRVFMPDLPPHPMLKLE